MIPCHIFGFMDGSPLVCLLRQLYGKIVLTFLYLFFWGENPLWWITVIELMNAGEMHNNRGGLPAPLSSPSDTAPVNQYSDADMQVLHTHLVYCTRDSSLVNQWSLKACFFLLLSHFGRKKRNVCHSDKYKRNIVTAWAPKWRERAKEETLDTLMFTAVSMFLSC